MLCVSNNKILQKYLSLKESVAKNLNINFVKILLDNNVTTHDIARKIAELNINDSIDAIMLQMPIPKNLDRNFVVSQIDRAKDVDGLRYCAGLESDYLPPVVLSILEAIKRSKTNLSDSTVCLIGKGFLVGAPLCRYFEDSKTSIKELHVADRDSPDISLLTKSSDIIISAAGVPSLVKREMVSRDCTLIDAGTTELNNSLVGDIDRSCYELASYYTPVPGGIGPVTIAMLMRNILLK